MNFAYLFIILCVKVIRYDALARHYVAKKFYSGPVLHLYWFVIMFVFVMLYVNNNELENAVVVCSVLHQTYF